MVGVEPTELRRSRIRCTGSASISVLILYALFDEKNFSCSTCRSC